jgi:hypothetical protein
VLLGHCNHESIKLRQFGIRLAGGSPGYLR